MTLILAIHNDFLLCSRLLFCPDGQALMPSAKKNKNLLKYLRSRKALPPPFFLLDNNREKILA